MTTHTLRAIQAQLGVGLVLAAVLGVTPLTAQTTTNPSSIEFTRSGDHYAVLRDGRPAVTRYDLRLYRVGAAQPFQTSSLGKPAADTTGRIRVQLSTTLASWPLGAGETYEARVSAVGPGGAAESAPSNPFDFAGSCGYALSTTNAAVTAGGGTGSITVTTASGCAWTANSSAGWITLTGPTSLAGVGAARFSVAANTAGTPRSGRLTVAGQTVTVAQAGVPCTYSLSSTAITLPSTASSASVAVATATGCSWSPASNVGWLTATAGRSGSGTVALSTTANVSATDRTGTLTIGTGTVTVKQRGTNPLSITSLTANASFPSPAGTPVTWTAKATGGTSPYTYQFWLYDGASWMVGRPWQQSATWTWQPAVPGQYLVQVWVRSAGSTTAYDGWRQATASVSKPGVLTVTAVTPSVQGAAAGRPVTWTVAAAGGTGPYTYKFWAYDGNQWQAMQDWSSSRTWVWTPPSPGTYIFQVWARNAGSAKRLDAYRSFGPYTAGLPSALAATALTADRPDPTPAGTPIIWSALASGGNGPYTYQFWISDGTTLRLGRDWGALPTWTWIPTTPGTYSVQVRVRNAGSSAEYDALRVMDSYVIESPVPLAVTGLVSDRAYPVAQDTPVTWTASAVGGTGPYSYKFFVYDGTSWRVGRDWSAKPAWTWIPAVPGSYWFQVWVRNGGSTENYDAWLQAGPATIKPAAPLAVSAFTLTRLTPLVARAPAVVTAAATGGHGPYTYQFWVFDGSRWSVGQSWSPSHMFSWTPPAPGTYSMQVWVRNSGSTGSWEAWGSLGGLVVVP